MLKRTVRPVMRILRHIAYTSASQSWYCHGFNRYPQFRLSIV